MANIGKYIKLFLLAKWAVVMSIAAIFGILIFGKPIYFKLARFWAKWVLIIGGVKLEIDGISMIDPNKSYIFCANHSSMIDIPVMIAGIKNDFRIIYKKELTKIPFFGWALSLSPYISIKRSSGRDSMASLEAAIESVRSGESVTIFPEGTRSLDGKLGKFKRGAFLLASRSGKEIVPVTIIGSQSVLPNKDIYLKKGTVRIIISEPINYQGTNKQDEADLIEDVFGIINNNLLKYSDSIIKND